MSTHNHRVLSEFHLTPQQWAILFAASYFLPAPVDQFIVEAQLEADENFTVEELTRAFDECLSNGWIVRANETRTQEFAIELGSENALQPKEGIVLTEAGNKLKELVSHALLETVEID